MQRFHSSTLDKTHGTLLKSKMIIEIETKSIWSCVTSNVSTTWNFFFYWCIFDAIRDADTSILYGNKNKLSTNQHTIFFGMTIYLIFFFDHRHVFGPLRVVRLDSVILRLKNIYFNLIT